MRRYVYVWADGVYLQARMEEAAECMLVLIGATPEGKKELVGFRESAQSWRELLLKGRAELISGVLTTVLEEQGYEPAVAQAHKFFANCTPEQMEQMKPHF